MDSLSRSALYRDWLLYPHLPHIKSGSASATHLIVLNFISSRLISIGELFGALPWGLHENVIRKYELNYLKFREELLMKLLS